MDAIQHNINKFIINGCFVGAQCHCFFSTHTFQANNKLNAMAIRFIHISNHGSCLVQHTSISISWKTVVDISTKLGCYFHLYTLVISMKCQSLLLYLPVMQLYFKSIKDQQAIAAMKLIHWDILSHICIDAFALAIKEVE